jgi:hypothetical protein
MLGGFTSGQSRLTEEAFMSEMLAAGGSPIEGSPEGEMARQPFGFDDDDQALMESPDLNLHNPSNSSRMRRSEMATDSPNNGQDQEDVYNFDKEDEYDYFMPALSGNGGIQSALVAAAA